MGDDEKTPLKLDFDSKVRVEFRGATITSDAGLLACRELDDALSLTDSADEFLKESRTGKNILHQLIPLLRQSVYSRLAGYDDTNDADRLSQDPALRVVVGWKGPDRNAASTSEMGRFETELLTQKENLKGIERLNVEWIKRALAKTVHRRIILGHRQFGESGAWRAGGSSLQRPLWMHVLSPLVLLQPVWRLRRGGSQTRQRPQRRWLEGVHQSHRRALPEAGGEAAVSSRRCFCQA